MVNYKMLIMIKVKVEAKENRVLKKLTLVIKGKKVEKKTQKAMKKLHMVKEL